MWSDFDMKNVACWQAAEVYSIVNPDADAVPDHVFRAVHTDMSVLIRSRPDAHGVESSLPGLLKRFNEPLEDVLVPVIGESGAGKSHLIRWLQLQLPQTKTREVIFVPKAQTNLRDIVRALVDRLPLNEQAEFRAELAVTDNALVGKPAQRTALLNQIQLALQNDTADRPSGLDRETEEFLLSGLRGVFLDPFLRERKFLRDNTFAAELAEHVFERPASYRPTEQRRLFSLSDLPLDVREVERAAATTQEFLSFLLPNEEYQKFAVAIVNRNLDWAIARCLNLSGDRLIALMLGIRRRLKSEGKSLVLLVEDFARLQGLDRALLDSLIMRDANLCVMRTALACTTGYFRDFVDTVRTRLTFVVDVTVSAEAEHGGLDRATFTARYLNALRLGESKLRAEKQVPADAHGNFPIENACDECVHRTECHGAFGESDGFGLYPFTSRAIEIMSERAGVDAKGAFNPRTFQKAVLRPVLLSAQELVDGRFPPRTLLDDLGGIQKLGPAEQNKLRVGNATDLSRRMALLELWDGTGQARNLPIAVHEAFAIPVLNLLQGEQPNRPVRPPEREQEKRGTRPQPQPEASNELRDWYNGHRTLSADTAGKLRTLLFKAIDEAIDWDSEGLAVRAFRATSGASKPFVPTSLYFHNQATHPTRALVQLTIPSDWDDEEDRARTVLALEAILQVERTGTWDFDEDFERLASLQECIAEWAGKVVAQLHVLDTAAGEWDPAACALAIRIAVVQLTVPESVVRSDIDAVQAGLRPFGSVPNYWSSELRQLVQEVVEKSDTLLDVIATRRSALKGGSTGNFMDTAALLAAIPSIRKRGWLPSVPEKAPAWSEPDTLVKLAKRVVGVMPRLVQEEVAERRKWLDEMVAAFGPKPTKEAIMATIGSLPAELNAHQIQGATDIAAARAGLDSTQFDEAIKVASDLPEQNVVRLGAISKGIATEMQQSRTLAKVLGTTLSRAERQVNSLLEVHGVEPGSENTHLQSIRKHLDSIEKVLDEHGKPT
jgi:hypothetical protein